MTILTGIDLVEVERVRKCIGSERFLRRVYSEAERELFASRGMNPQTAAANFAAKEAFSKALGTGVRGFSLNEVSLLRDGLGKPYFELTGRALSIVEQNNYTLSVSVTHTREYASAVVVCYGG